MTIILFLIDTSASMNQRTYLGSKPTLLDVAKDAVEKFLKARARDMASRGDRYMLLTFEDPPYNIKAGWKESHAVFMNELRNLQAISFTNMGPALKNAFDLLNLNRMQSGIDMYGLGRCPYYLEPSIIIVITDGSTLTTPVGVANNLELPMQNQAVPGSELTREPFRWDQRLFSLVLRMTGSPTTDDTSPILQQDNSPISAMCSVTAGRSYAVNSMKTLMQSIDSLVQKIQSGVVIQFEKIGPDPPPPTKPTILASNNSASTNSNATENSNQQEQATDLTTSVEVIKVPSELHSSKCLLYVPREPRQKNFVGHWPIPESYWPDANLTTLPQRTAHPIVKFTCVGVEPHVMDALPFDKYELESCALTKYILSRKEPHLAWQVFMSNSNKLSDLGPPFGYLKASTNLNCVNLYVLPYNYPSLLPLIDEMFKKPHHSGKSKDWKQPFDDYLRSMPAYYANPLRRALSRMGAQAFIPEVLDQNCFSHVVHSKLRNYKMEAKLQFDKLVASVAQPKPQNFETIRVLQCGNNLKAQVESTSYMNMRCTGRPSNAFAYRYINMKSELNEFTNYTIRVRDRISTVHCNENLKVKHTFRNPYDINREDLIDQIQLMRANFMQLPSRIKQKDEDQLHSLPVAQMGNYQEYLKKRPAPLREIESTPIRQHMFGNPFKIDKKGMMVDEADIDLNSSSPKNKNKITPNQRRRGPLPRDFYIFGPNSWQRSPSPNRFSDKEAGNNSQNHVEQNGQAKGEDTKLNNTDHENTSITTSSSQEPQGQGKYPEVFFPSEDDLEICRQLAKQVRNPNPNMISIISTISSYEGVKRKYLLEETRREAKRFKRTSLIDQLNFSK